MMTRDQITNSKQLGAEDTIRFECHSGLACFTRCCKNADMYLYPYDVIRMKNRLGVSSDRFLEQYTLQAIRDNPYFPSLMLKMTDNEEKPCPFLSSDGCIIYKDRPSSCRTYPLERAVSRIDYKNERVFCYFITNHSYCLGHQASREWTIEKWLDDQKIDLFNDMNELWVDMDTIFRRNPWGPQGFDSPAFKMAFMACFNVDELKKFICESTFLSRFNVPMERVEKLMISDVELMKFGFDWIKFFLTNTGPLKPNKRILLQIPFSIVSKG